MQKFALLVAGGSGQRMQSELPKQFLSVSGLPVLMHTIKAFSFDDIEISVVLPEGQINYWQELVEQFKFDIPHKIVAGGETRFHSVANGLKHIPSSEGLVAIHDGVRPLIDREIIQQSFASALDFGSAVTAVPLKDSIRQLNGRQSTAKSREQFRVVQTPQTFKLDLIRQAFQQGYQPNFTDDATVLEATGHQIHLIQGSYRNIKITTPEDILIAESLLKA